MTEDKFYEELKKLNISLTEKQKEQFKKYYEMLVEWNQKMNLTAIVAKDQVYLKHFYDSATLTKIINLEEAENLCDIGTGAGFPGIVLKILFPSLSVTLVDSLNKRVMFLNHVIESLKLVDIRAIHARAEEYALSHREYYDVVTCRAVAPLSILLEYAVPIVKVGKFFIPMKGDIAQEITGARNAILKMNVKLIDKESFCLPIENSYRTILKFEKLSKTSVKYPRKFSEIKKNPL